MGKSAGAGGVAAKAKAKAEPKAEAKADAKAKAKPQAKDAPSKDAADGKPEAQDPQAKLVEEANQEYADALKTEKVRVDLREANRKAAAAGPQLTGSRDKSMKGVDRFKNKLKAFKGESEMDAVLKDLNSVDASKYVPEIADCIMEAAGVTLKLKELPAACKVCSQLLATYEDFAAVLAKAIKKAYDGTPPTDLNRRRFLFRLCAELCLVEGIPSTGKELHDMVKELCDVGAAEEQLILNFTIISSLAQKHAASCFGVVPSRQASLEQALGKPWVERQCVLREPLQLQLQQLAVNAYQSSAAGLLQGANARLVEQEKVNAKLRIDKGQVDAENQQKHNDLKESFTKLQGILSTLSECLNQPMPSSVEEDTGVSRIGGAEKKEDEDTKVDDLALLWEDTEQQKFYEDLCELKDVIPAVLLNSGKGQAPAEAPAALAAGGEDGKDVKAEEKKEEKKPKEEKDAMVQSDFELYLLRVSKAETAKQIDELVMEFFHEYNTKGNRRALAHQLFSVQRTKLHLLAPHSRFIATAGPYLTGVAPYVLQGLQQELEQQMKDKNEGKMEEKIRTVRYLCELCKFKVCPPGVILDTFNTLCDDFSHINAELCANILQCCGRYLRYTPETSTRTDNLLERMLRLKNAKSLPLRLEIMLEDSYYQVKPPESKRQKRKEKDPLEQFTQSLIFDRLYREEDEDKVLRLVRKLPWTDHPAPGWLKKCLLDLNMHANYESLYQVASLLSGLAKYRDVFVIDVIDALFENIQSSVERNDFREMPLRVRQCKLLGELYNYRLVDSNLIFDTLYQLIGFGGPTSHKAGQLVTAHKIVERQLAARKGTLGSISEEGGSSGSAAAGAADGAGQMLPAFLADPQHALEAPWDFFRVKLVCVLLETCGHYFDRGAAKGKLDRFLQFFIRYVHTKGELPLRFMNMVHDTLERLRPKLAFPETKAQADEAILKLLEGERDQLDIGGGEDQEKKEAAMEEDDSSEDEESGSEEDDESSGEEDSEEEESESESDEDEEDYERGDEAHARHNSELEEFDKEMKQLLSDSLEKEKQVGQRVLAELPMPEQAVAKRADASPNAVPGAFGLLQRKTGGKLLVKQIEIPEDSKLVRARVAEEDSLSKEHQDLKSFIMQYDSSAPSVTRLHAGKGYPKGFGKGFGKGRRQERDYVKEEFMPDSEPPPPTMRIMYGRGGRGTSKGSGGGGRGRGPGTPSQAGAKGSF